MRLLLVILLLSACRLSPNSQLVTIRSPAAINYPLTAMEDGSIDSRLKGLSQYGLLAEASYHPEIEDLDKICPYPSKYAKRWQRVISSVDTNHSVPRLKDYGYRVTGLGYSVWEDISAKGGAKLALVFRGTDFKSLGDWYSNLRWITRLNPLTWDQYQQTRDLVTQLVPQLKRRFGNDVEIVSVGHSLGAGLAQHAAYSSPDIRLVYAFAASPVTGSTSLDSRVSKKDVTIFRAYEAGEVLSGVRSLQRSIIALDQKDPKIVELRFNFRSTFKKNSVGGGPISQHKIVQLSCDLICRVENNNSVDVCKRSRQ